MVDYSLDIFLLPTCDKEFNGGEVMMMLIFWDDGGL